MAKVGSVTGGDNDGDGPDPITSTPRDSISCKVLPPSSLVTKEMLIQLFPHPSLTGTSLLRGRVALRTIAPTGIAYASVT